MVLPGAKKNILEASSHRRENIYSLEFYLRGFNPHLFYYQTLGLSTEAEIGQKYLNLTINWIPNCDI